MPRGQPDYGMTQPSAYIASLSDMGELAARLGSIVLFDRRGRVIYLDDCEGTVLKGYPTLVGGGAIVLDAVYPNSGSQCIKFTSGPAAIDHAMLEKRFPPLLSERVGLEFLFSQPDTDTTLALLIQYHDGTNSHSGRIRLEFNAKTLDYQSGAIAYTLIADLDAFHAGTFLYYPVKLVIDIETSTFVRVLFAGTQHDISTLPLYTVASGAAPHFSFGIDLDRRAGTGGVVYIDDIIITEDEV